MEACSQVFFLLLCSYISICKCDDNENDLNPYIHFVIREICDTEAEKKLLKQQKALKAIVCSC